MEHEIIYDLLPLYHDGVCSEASRRAVEEHLETCRDCQKALAAMDAPLPEAEKQAVDDGAAVKKIRDEWKKSKWKARLKGALITLLACAALAGGYWALFQWYSCQVPVEVLEVSELAQLSDGRVVFHLFVNDQYDLNRVDYQDEDGIRYIVPLRPLICRERSTDGGLWDWDYCIDVAESNEWNDRYGDSVDITAVYLGRGEDAILLWEEGMELPAASAADEERWGYEPGSAEYWAAREEN